MGKVLVGVGKVLLITGKVMFGEAKSAEYQLNMLQGNL